MDQQLLATLAIDTNDFTGGLNDAKSALQSFGTTVGGVFGGLMLDQLFNTITSSLQSMVSSIGETGSTFEDFSSRMDILVGTVAQASDAMGNAAAVGALKTKISTMESADALDKYNEKMQEIRDKMAETGLGTNILDAQTSFSEQVQTLQENLASKIISIQDQIQTAQDSVNDKHIASVQSMQDSLQGMQDSHANTIADREEKQQEELGKVQSSVSKAALQAKFDQENKMADDGWKRQYDLRQKQEEERIAKEDARNKAAADKKVAQLQEQIKKEQAAETEHEAKLQEQSDKRIALYKKENDQKLALYQKELNDEMEMRKIQLAKEQEATLKTQDATSGMGVKKLGMTQIGMFDTDSFSDAGEKADDLKKKMVALGESSPFKTEDLLKSAETLQMHGINAEKAMPMIMKMAGAMHKDLGTTTQAVIMGTVDNLMILTRQFGLSSTAMQQAFGRPIKTSNDFLEALDKIAKTRFARGIDAESATIEGRMNILHSKFDMMALDILGIDKTTLAVKPGKLFDEMMKSLSMLTSYLTTHGPQISSTLEKIGDAIAIAAKFFREHSTIIIAALAGIVIFLGILSIGMGIMTVALTIAAVAASPLATGIVLIAVAAGALAFQLIILGVAFMKAWPDLVSGFNALPGIVSTAFTAVMKMFGDWMSSFHEWGGKLGNSLIEGLKQALINLTGPLGIAVQAAFKMFKGNSPPETGPLQDIDKWGYNIGMAWVQGLHLAIGNLQFPNISLAGLAGGLGQSFNTNTSNNIAISNQFNVTSQANASMAASYVAHQINHTGLV